MKKINITFISLLAELFNKHNFELEMENTDIKSIIDMIADKFGQKTYEIFYKKPGVIDEKILIIRNDEQINLDEINDLHLENNDNLIFIPAIAGG